MRSVKRDCSEETVLEQFRSDNNCRAVFTIELLTSLNVCQAPMMVSAVACIIGNLAYCLSFDAKSLTLLVIARLITGFGECLPL